MQELSQREVELLDALEYARDIEDEDAADCIMAELRAEQMMLRHEAMPF